MYLYKKLSKEFALLKKHPRVRRMFLPSNDNLQMSCERTHYKMAKFTAQHFKFISLLGGCRHCVCDTPLRSFKLQQSMGFIISLPSSAHSHHQ